MANNKMDEKSSERVGARPSARGSGIDANTNRLFPLQDFEKAKSGMNRLEQEIDILQGQIVEKRHEWTSCFVRMAQFIKPYYDRAQVQRNKLNGNDAPLASSVRSASTQHLTPELQLKPTRSTSAPIAAPMLTPPASPRPFLRADTQLPEATNGGQEPALNKDTPRTSSRKRKVGPMKEEKATGSSKKTNTRSAPVYRK
ncbi:hypothetical protein MMC28_011696 [Mycoblastus sanguinarius]|nr:hypothetical protein [Mycoblastus sanguinarius]